jgi:isoquinoline 1-oxidoreductase alpha subunit
MARCRGAGYALFYALCADGARPELEKPPVPRFTVHGKPVTVDADPGTKFGCGMALCGACTVHIDGQPVRSCSMALGAVEGRQVTTIEAVGATPAGQAVQQAWIARDVPQCGYCHSGQIMSACALLADKRQPSDADIDAAMSGNVCRCGTYNQIRAAIKDAVVMLNKGA